MTKTPGYAAIEPHSMTIYGIGGTRQDAEDDARDNGADLSDVYHAPSAQDLREMETHGGLATLPCTQDVIDAVTEHGGAHDDVPATIEDGVIRLAVYIELYEDNAGGLYYCRRNGGALYHETTPDALVLYATSLPDGQWRDHAEHLRDRGEDDWSLDRLDAVSDHATLVAISHPDGTWDEYTGEMCTSAQLHVLGHRVEA